MNNDYKRIRNIYAGIAGALILVLGFVATRLHHGDGQTGMLALTTNTVAKASGPSTLANSTITDDGTTVIVTAAGSTLLQSALTNVQGNLKNDGTNKIGGTVAVTGISTALVNYAPAGITSAVILDVTNTTAIAATGFAAGQVTGQLLFVRNNKASASTITFFNLDPSSAAANRVSMTGGNDWLMRPGGEVDFYYNGTNWVQFAQATTAFPVIIVDGNASFGPAPTQQTISVGIPTVNFGTLTVDSTNFAGTILTIGAHTSVQLTFGGVPFINASHCVASASGGATVEVVEVTQSAGAPSFSCFTSTTGVGANCNDITYICSGH